MRNELDRQFSPQLKFIDKIPNFYVFDGCYVGPLQKSEVIIPITGATP